MMVLTAANNKQGRKARDHNTSFRRRLQRMRRIAWLHCIERKARKESLLVSWVVPASTHNHSSFIVQHVWQLHEGFLRQIFNHFSLGFHFIHCNKTLKHEMCWKAAQTTFDLFSAPSTRPLSRYLLDDPALWLVQILHEFPFDARTHARNSPESQSEQSRIQGA